MSEAAELVARIGKLNEMIKVAADDARKARYSGSVSKYVLCAAQLASLRAQRVELRAEKMKIDARP